MKIRSITYFCNPKFPAREEVIGRAGSFLARAKAAYEAAGYEVQSLRLASPPFARFLGEGNLDQLPRAAEELDELLHANGIGYGSMGPALPTVPRSYEVIPEAVAASKAMFFGGITADRRGGMDMAAVRACAQVIVKCAPIESNGFANLRFAALANVPPGSPFFPAAYHEGASPAFAIATEAADLAVDAFDASGTVNDGRKGLIDAIEKHARALARVARSLSGYPDGQGGGARKRGPGFLGIDFSLAPFPEERRSLGTALERLGVPRAGLHGSLAAAAILTECIDRARFPRTGFCGLFMPVLEDATLSRRAAEGSLGVKDVLLYSAVCGTGLDTLALPGDATAEQIAPVLADLSAMALRLGKALTARLMPVPGKRAGDATGFDFAFFSNSKVLRLDSEPLRGPLAEGGVIPVRPR